MKSLKSALCLVVSAIGIFASATHAVAQNAASLEIRGSVAVNCTISIIPTAKATNLDILGGEKDTLVGTATETCNSGNGYTVQVTSGNQGSLINKANGAVPSTYQARYDDGTGQIAEKIVANRDKAQFGRQGRLMVSFAGNSQAIAGVYSDTINLVIAAK
jgi:hypothetical protein